MGENLRPKMRGGTSSYPRGFCYVQGGTDDGRQRGSYFRGGIRQEAGGLSTTVEDANDVNYQITLGTGEIIEGNDKPTWLKEKTITFADIREVHNRRESSATYKKRRGLRDRPLTF